MIAGDYGPREIQALTEDGRLVLINCLGGMEAKLHIAHLMRRRLTITGSTLRSLPVAFKGSVTDALWKNVWPLLEPARSSRSFSKLSRWSRRRRRTG